MHPPLIIFSNSYFFFLLSRPDKSVNVLNTTFDKLEYFFFCIISFTNKINKIRINFFIKKHHPASFAGGQCFSTICGTSIVSFPYFPSFVILYGCLLVWNPVPSVGFAVRSLSASL